MERVVKLEQLNRQEALRYLGYGDCEPDDRIRELLECCESEILRVARPMYVYKVFDIMNSDGDTGIQLQGTGFSLTGNSIKSHLAGCSKAVLMAVTVSGDIDRLIRISQVKDMAEAVVMDSLASVAVEQVCDTVEKFIKQDFPKYYQTFRFGIGYGDLPVTLQKNFVNVLDAPKLIGLNVNSSCMLTPTKSVTAVIGLSDKEINQVARGCQTCNMRGVCKFRKKGGHCNGE